MEWMGSRFLGGHFGVDRGSGGGGTNAGESGGCWDRVGVVGEGWGGGVAGEWS